MTKTIKSAFRIAFLPALILGAGALVATEDAVAQKKDAGKTSSKGDKKIASKKGVEGSLGSKEIDADQLPGKLEIGIALGSVAGMIAAIKYL